MFRSVSFSAMAPLPAAAVEPITEMWTLYAFGTVVIFLRVFCRWRLVGIFNFKPDDYLVLLAWVSNHESIRYPSVQSSC